MSAREGFYRYVQHELVEDYHRLGWLWVAYAGEWSCLMHWACDCPVRSLKQ